MYDLDTKEYFVSRDVQFFEDVFSFFEKSKDHNKEQFDAYLRQPPLGDFDDAFKIVDYNVNDAVNDVEVVPTGENID